MKTIYLLIFVPIFFVSNSLAQNFGFKIGTNVSFMHDYSNTERNGTDIYMLFNSGVTFQNQNKNNNSYSLNLYYSGKGYKRNGHHIKFNTIDLSAIYSPRMLKNKVYLNIGPYLSYGLSGEKYITWLGISKIAFGNNYTQYKRIDYGGIVGVGFKLLENIYSNINYHQGFRNLEFNESDNPPLFFLSNEGLYAAHIDISVKFYIW